VKIAPLLLLLGACAGDIDPEWQLDHTRIVAVRATPAAYSVRYDLADRSDRCDQGRTDLDASAGSGGRGVAEVALPMHCRGRR